jgi:hypothetical protein
LRTQRSADRERGWELSIAYSRLGFLLSLSDGRLDDARQALLHAQERGPGDSWVTDWNLANVAARTGDLSEARSRLAKVADRVPDWTELGGTAVAVFYVPGRPAEESIVTFNQETGGALFMLQQAVLDHVGGDEDSESMIAALKACAENMDDKTRAVAEWVAEMLQQRAVEESIPNTDTDARN